MEDRPLCEILIGKIRGIPEPPLAHDWIQANLEHVAYLVGRVAAPAVP